MSDLISRSELIENFRKCYSGHLGMENSDACMTFHGICNVINNTNTVYDVDKVVEELEKAKHEIASEDYCRSINDKEKCDGRNCFECCAEYLIEIVKQGGVSDDVCEWHGEQSRLVTYTNFTTACGYNFDLQMNNELLKAFRYCPYCGKKIKVGGMNETK